MKKIMLSIIALLLVAGGGSALMARGMMGGNTGGCGGPGYGMDGGPGFGMGMMYNDLKLTDDQELKIHKINKDYADKFFEARKDRDAFEKVRESHRKEVEKVLTKEQLEKLNEYRGPHHGKGKRMMGDGNWRPGMMHDYLKLTDDQAQKIHKINMDFHEKMFQSRNNPDELGKLRESHRKEIEKVLTKEQVEKLKDFRDHHRGMEGCPGFGIGGMW